MDDETIIETKFARIMCSARSGKHQHERSP